MLESGIGKKEFEGNGIDYKTIDYKALENETNYKPCIKFEDGIELVINKIKEELNTFTPPQQ